MLIHSILDVTHTHTHMRWVSRLVRKSACGLCMQIHFNIKFKSISITHHYLFRLKLYRKHSSTTVRDSRPKCVGFRCTVPSVGSLFRKQINAFVDWIKFPGATKFYYVLRHWIRVEDTRNRITYNGPQRPHCVLKHTHTQCNWKEFRLVLQKTHTFSR